MSAEILTFVPQAQLSALENLQGFIDVAKNKLKIFGEDLPFNEDRWEISKYINIKTKARGETAVIFSNWETSGQRANKSMAMPEPYLTFAKAYFRY